MFIYKNLSLVADNYYGNCNIMNYSIAILLSLRKEEGLCLDNGEQLLYYSFIKEVGSKRGEEVKEPGWSVNIVEK